MGWMVCEKHLPNTCFEKAMEPDTAIAAINKFSPEPVAAEDVYTFRAVLANDKYDRSHERFTPEILHRFADTIVGKSILPGHDKRAMPLGKWFGASVRKNVDGTHDLLVDGYLSAKGEAAQLVRLGIASDLSVGFAADVRTCDIDGKDYDGPGCKHGAGRDYDGKKATVTYGGDLAAYEAREGSLVWLGCQYGAQVASAKAAADEYSSRVTYKSVDFIDPPEGDKDMPTVEELQKAVSEREDEVKALKVKVAELEPKATAGDAYFGSLKDAIVKKATTLGDDIDIYTAALSGTNLETLQKWDQALQKRFDEKFPPSPNARMLGHGAVIDPAHNPEGSGEPDHRRKSFSPLAGLKAGG